MDHLIFPDGKRIILLAEGAWSTWAAARDTRPYVMSSSFANQSWRRSNCSAIRRSIRDGVYVLPKHLDENVARLQLSKLGAQLTELTDIQAKYIGVPVQGPYKVDQYRY